MNKDKALKIAFEALSEGAYGKKKEKAIQACKEALEQPAQEPVGFTITGKLGDRCSFKSTTIKKGDKVYTHPAPAQEPYLWELFFENGTHEGFTGNKGMAAEWGENKLALYTRPAPQPDTKPNALEMAGFELDGVIADIKMGDEFDCVCLDTVVRVRKTIADYVAQPAQEPVLPNNRWSKENELIESWKQSAQEPVAHIKQGMDGYPKLVFNGKFEYESISAKLDDIALYTHPASQPAQEPVLNVTQILNEFPLLDDEGLDEDKYPCEWSLQQDRKRLHAMLYTHFAPSWQGLSDDEIDKIYFKTFDTWSSEVDVEFARAIEQALRERNCNDTK